MDRKVGWVFSKRQKSIGVVVVGYGGLLQCVTFARAGAPEKMCRALPSPSFWFKACFVPSKRSTYQLTEHFTEVDVSYIVICVFGWSSWSLFEP